MKVFAEMHAIEKICGAGQIGPVRQTAGGFATLLLQSALCPYFKRVREVVDIRAMDVSRRNTFDIFDELRESASVYNTQHTDSVLKRKRKKKRKPVDVLCSDKHSTADYVRFLAHVDEPEVRHFMALSCTGQ